MSDVIAVLIAGAAIVLNTVAIVALEMRVRRVEQRSQKYWVPVEGAEQVRHSSPGAWIQYDPRCPYCWHLAQAVASMNRQLGEKPPLDKSTRRE